MLNEFIPLQPIDYSFDSRRNRKNKNKGKRVVNHNDFIKFNFDPLNYKIR